MLCDGHVHMGYFCRMGHKFPFYYSPRRVFGVLDRAGVDEFIVSSTNAQSQEIPIKEIVREAKEMKRIAGKRAHIFFWMSGHLYDEDPTMAYLETGLFEGIKLHEMVTPWVTKRTSDLRRILFKAAELRLPVQFHAGPMNGCRPVDLAVWAEEFPNVNFDLAHARPMNEMAKVVSSHENIFTDMAYMPFPEFFVDYEWKNRLMFGSDFPAYHMTDSRMFSVSYRERCRANLEIIRLCNNAFYNFLNCKKIKRMRQD